MAAIAKSKITCLLVDIGGVLLTDGWGHASRTLAAEAFGLNPKEMETRHYENFYTYEIGKITIEEYLKRVVFDKRRIFSPNSFMKFMYAQSKPFPRMINLITQIKAKYGLKIVVVSNEARELNAYRIRKFRLDLFVDAFISSCYVGLRKPDKDIFRLALDISQAKPEQIVYIENTSMFVQIAQSMGIQSILHTDYKSTCAQLASFGLKVPKLERE